MAEEPDGLLRVDALFTGYGKKGVVRSVSLQIERGEIVALIGHNGAGKSTLLKAIFGLLQIWNGAVSLDGRRLAPPTPRGLLRSGVAYVPQGNRVFTDLTVHENLEMGGVTLPKGRLRHSLDRVLVLFPELKNRLRQRAGTLSGGEKQMLALANGLVVSPRLLLLDEPSLGLAPTLVIQTLNRVREICGTQGAAALIIEQKVREVLKISNRVYVLRNGTISFTGPAEALRDESRLREVYL